MLKLLSFFYYTDVCVLQALLPAAGLLQLNEVKKACCEFLSSQLHPSNCLGIRAFADLHACSQLLAQANSYAGLSGFFCLCLFPFAESCCSMHCDRNLKLGTAWIPAQIVMLLGLRFIYIHTYIHTHLSIYIYIYIYFVFLNLR